MANILPVFLPFAACGNICIYCNQHAVTKTTTPDDIVNFAESQIVKWKNITPEWREIAFYGGNFGAIPTKIRKELYALAKKYYISLIRYSTRPDTVTEMLMSEACEYGVNVIELGVQSLDNDVLRMNGRPYNSEKVFEAISDVKRATKCGIQLMIGMHGQTVLSAIDDAATLTTSGADYARIYPTLVLKDTQLAEIWRNGKYRPLSLAETLVTVCAMYIYFTANNMKVIRMGLPDDITEESTLAGPKHKAMGDMVKTLCAMLYAENGGKIKFAGYKGLVRKYYKDAYDSAEESPDFRTVSKHLERYLIENSKRFIEGKTFELAERLAGTADNR